MSTQGRASIVSVRLPTQCVQVAKFANAQEIINHVSCEELFAAN